MWGRLDPKNIIQVSPPFSFMFFGSLNNSYCIMNEMLDLGLRTGHIFALVDGVSEEGYKIIGLYSSRQKAELAQEYAMGMINAEEEKDDPAGERTYGSDYGKHITKPAKHHLFTNLHVVGPFSLDRSFTKI